MKEECEDSSTAIQYMSSVELKLKRKYPKTVKEVFDNSKLESRLDDLEQFYNLPKETEENALIKYKIFEEIVNKSKLPEFEYNKLTIKVLEKLIKEIFYTQEKHM